MGACAFDLAWYGNIANPQGVVGDIVNRWFAAKSTILSIYSSVAFEAPSYFISALKRSPLNALCGLIEHTYLVEEFAARYAALANFYEIGTFDARLMPAIHEFQSTSAEFVKVSKFLFNTSQHSAETIFNFYEGCRRMDDLLDSITSSLED
jgi:hypothetical protein